MSEQRKNDTSASSCGFGRCCTGPGKWIRIVLVVAVFGTVIALNVWRRDTPSETAAPASGPAATAAAGGPLAKMEQRLPRLLDLGAGACIPCKKMKPILEDLTANYADTFETVFIDVWQNEGEGQKYGIRTIPTQIFFGADGKELFRHVGFMSKEDILNTWKELGVERVAVEDPEAGR